ncbi:MAG: ATP-grasp domain-containing protein [Candidatus Bathyarchaeota archaeon]|nr:ATP-grasp domain-containing protein [Candidatus Bathyarchaeota archaeon]
MKVLLYEYVSSGGYSDKPIPAGLACEGYAMLRGLAADFKASGHEVTVMLDARFAAFNPPVDADHVFLVESSDVSKVIKQALRGMDAVYVVAPEAEGALQSITEDVEESGVFSLNCPAASIGEASDKAALKARAESLDLNFPKTEICRINDTAEEIIDAVKGKLGFPVVVKPLRSAGCEGLSAVQNPSQLKKATFKIKDKAAENQFTIQKLISGIPISVSLICAGTAALPISLNLQKVTLDSAEGSSSYDGGVVPFDHELKTEAFAAAKRLVESFGNLRGYVGVDFVLSKDKVFVIEVNPRLTTSYVGLRNVANFNLAESVIQAVSEKQLPKNAETHGFSCFKKTPIHHPNPSVWQDICSLEAVTAPPFFFADAAGSCAIIQARGKTFEEASSGLREAEKELQQICRGGTCT